MSYKKYLTTNITLDALALCAGAILTLAFAPFHLFPLAVLSPALLLGLWLHQSPGRAFFRGWLFGLGFFTTGVYWLFISIHTFGNVPVYLATFFTGVFISILAVFPGLTGYYLNRYFPGTSQINLLCAFPAIWVFLEWIRSWLFTGFPWLLLGYSQIDSPLKGFAPILSVFCISLAVLFSAALLVNAIVQLNQNHRKNFYLSVIGFAAIWILGGALSLISWTKPFGSPIQVSLIQGNIPQALKWSPDSLIPTLNRYKELSENHWNSKIVIWPESAIPIPLHLVTDFIDEMDGIAKKNGASFITGIPVKARPDQYYNAVIATGKADGFYLKQHLVPFGEFVPLQQLFGRFFQFLDIPMSSFVPGNNRPHPIVANGIKISTFICYEITYPEQVLSQDGNTNLVLTVSNDAWFGHSIAQAQHLEMAQMRALELNRPVLSVSNDGITAIIAPNGNIQARAPQFQSYVLTGTVQPTEGETPWQIVGLGPVLFGLLGMLIFAVRKNRVIVKEQQALEMS